MTKEVSTVLNPEHNEMFCFVFSLNVHSPQIKCHYFRSANKIIHHLQRLHTDTQLHTDSMVPLADNANLVGGFDADTA